MFHNTFGAYSAYHLALAKIAKLHRTWTIFLHLALLGWPPKTQTHKSLPLRTTENVPFPPLMKPMGPQTKPLFFDAVMFGWQMCAGKVRYIAIENVPSLPLVTKGSKTNPLKCWVCEVWCTHVKLNKSQQKMYPTQTWAQGAHRQSLL